jgi:hypothetical protein
MFLGSNQPATEFQCLINALTGKLGSGTTLPRGIMSGASKNTADCMHPQHAALFTTIDQYVKAHHHCFVAECDPYPPAEWSICIRPTEENTRVLVRGVYACKYIRLSLKEVEEICAGNTVPPKLAERIDRELRSLSDTVPD